MRIVLRWAWIGIGLLSGCAALRPGAGSPAEPDVPAQWTGAEATSGRVSLADWWQRFDDPQLTQLVLQALQSNTGVLGAQAALREARALRDVAGAALQPSVGSSASVQQGTLDGRSTGHNFQVGLDASWELDIFGGLRAARDTAEATARASAANLGDVQVSLAAEVALSYISLRNAQARLRVAALNLASQQQTLQLTDWRTQAGLLSTLEAAQARAAAAQTAAQLPALRTAIAQSAHALAVLTGQPPAALDNRLATATAVPQPAGTLALSLPAETLRQRPDVRAAEHQLQAAQGRLLQADAARHPDFRLSGSLGLNALTLGSLGSSALATTLLAGVSWSLWDGGAARSRVDAQQAALAQSRASYRGTVLGALKDVEDALVALRGDRERLRALQQAAEAATSAATLAGQRYGSGLVDFQTVLETQRSQLSAQDGAASAAADVSADHVRLFKALGGGWRPDDTPAPNPATPTSAPTP